MFWSNARSSRARSAANRARSLCAQFLFHGPLPLVLRLTRTPSAVRVGGETGYLVILLSGVPDLDQIASEVGTSYFLTKPYRLAQILALVNQALVERAAPRRAVVT